jgi:hypothetical protein
MTAIIRMFRFISCMIRKVPFYEAQDGCYYCAMCPRATSLGNCERGERMQYHNCGTVDIETEGDSQ